MHFSPFMFWLILETVSTSQLSWFPRNKRFKIEHLPVQGSAYRRFYSFSQMIVRLFVEILSYEILIVILHMWQNGERIPVKRNKTNKEYIVHV